MLPKLKKRRIKHTQFKNEWKTKQNLNSKTILILLDIQERKNINLICKDLVSWVVRSKILT